MAGKRIELEKGAREGLSRALARYLKDELEVEIGGMETLLLLDFISERMGPHYYNQALYDVRTLLQARFETLGEAVYDLERPAKV